MKTPYLIEIPRRSSTCALGQEALQAGTEYYSTLEEAEETKLLRKDYCLACWEQVISKGQTYWKSKVPMKKDETSLPQDRSERALELLRRSLSSPDISCQQEAFVLALYLARKRKLFLRQELQQVNGDRFSLYEVAETEEMLAVKKMALSSLQIDKIQTSLAYQFRSA